MLGRVVRLGDGLDSASEVVDTPPQPFRIDDAQATLLSHLNDKLRARQRIRSMRADRDIEVISVDAPGSIDVLRGAGTTGRDDGNILKPVGTARLTADPYLCIFAH